MDFNYVENCKNGIVVKDVRNFELDHIFECGQCFRWYKEENGSYIGVVHGKVIEIEKVNNDVVLYNATEEDFKKIWVEYFDLYRDYGEVKNILSKDDILAESVKFGHGIRLLKQDPFEIIVSFIISANNRIPMIKKAIRNISERWGGAIEYKGKVYYSFPKVEELKNATEDELRSCGVGFRAKYIKDTVNKIYQNSIQECKEYNKEYDMLWIKNQEDDICHKMLQNYSGIGAKVADCVMLFSMGKYSAFPVDVWVKRAMQYFYLAPDVSLKKIRDFAREKFGNLSGFAQQYLFYYARENKIDVNQK
ncbi:DNA-3-methyladenine glycosylase [Clostridium sp. Marseille-Q2269]|uniref:DNA-3-methyladenine glycosylase family protein n=1 Tax=Clostridium sp. Marseille-Q2269 TaxID=2942205 RepID=UPI0020746866|nr:DNA-3-methyladenine glycosylase [Clostridium sp. Marseille-Q2269]